MGGLLATVEEGSGVVTPLLSDQQGHVLGRIGGGVVTWNKVELGAYGLGPNSTVPAVSSVSDIPGATVWRGMRRDPTGLYWMGARYYDPASGRFLSPDPMGHVASLGLYDYCNGDPINGIDPEGRLGKTVEKVGISIGTEIGKVASTLALPVTNYFTEKGEWIFPKGGSTELSDYHNAFTNGIRGNIESVQQYADLLGMPGYFNPSHGTFVDLMQSAMQVLFLGVGDSLAKGYAQGLSQMSPLYNVYGHSQGVLTATNAALWYGVPQEANFVLKSPPIPSFRVAAIVDVVNHGTYNYIQPTYNVANIYSPALNPIKLASGFKDIISGFKYHTSIGY